MASFSQFQETIAIVQSLEVFSAANFNQFAKTVALKVLGSCVRTASQKVEDIPRPSAVASISVRMYANLSNCKAHLLRV